MDGEHSNTIALLVTSAIAFLIVTYIGFKIFLIPFGFFKKLVDENTSGFDRKIVFLILLWTIVLCPEPFIYVWRWIIDLSNSILGNGILLQSQISSVYSQQCNDLGLCVNQLGFIFLRFWQNSIVEALQRFSVPDGLANAGLLFAIGVTSISLLSRQRQLIIGQLGKVNAGSAATLIVLTISFAIAIYLAIIAIIAVPVFGQKIPEIAPLLEKLKAELNDVDSKLNEKPTNFGELAKERAQLPSQEQFKKLILEKYPNTKNTFVTNIWAIQLGKWDQVAALLKDAEDSAASAAAQYKKDAEYFFQINNAGRVGETATQRHVSSIADSFTAWKRVYNDNLEACDNSLHSDLSQLSSWQSALEQIAANDPINGPASVPNEGASDRSQCYNIKPAARDFLPPRVTESLGPFGFAADWLLQTENAELALITGLLGFGFFGALATSFIREYAVTPGTEIPKLGFVVPAFIRGVAAAILVFLLAKGGTAVFTKGDVPLNAYAIFFACFVAAVFSEDVWLWARRRQGDALPTGGGKEPG